MRYIFFGTPHIAALALRKLIEAGMPPLALVTNPDRPAGRKKILTPPETKRLLLELGVSIPVFQPEKPADIASELKALDPDFGVVLAYGHILPPSILEIPRLGIVGTHPSLLPKYRGPSPIQTALLEGEVETGVTLYVMGPGLDDGPVFAEEKLAIRNMTHDELTEALGTLAGDMLVRTLPLFAEGNVTAVPQEHSLATFTRKFGSMDGFVEDADLRAALTGDRAKARTLYHTIRALNPEPGVWTVRGGKRIKLLRAKLENETLQLLEIQYEGKTPEPFRGF